MFQIGGPTNFTNEIYCGGFAVQKRTIPLCKQIDLFEFPLKFLLSSNLTKPEPQQ